MEWARIESTCPFCRTRFTSVTHCRFGPYPVEPARLMVVKRFSLWLQSADSPCNNEPIMRHHRWIRPLNLGGFSRDLRVV